MNHIVRHEPRRLEYVQAFHGFVVFDFNLRVFEHKSSSKVRRHTTSVDVLAKVVIALTETPSMNHSVEK